MILKKMGRRNQKIENMKQNNAYVIFSNMKQ